MTNARKFCFYTLSVLLPAASCKETYVYPYILPETGYLVIEGSVNNGHDTTTLVLSRTTPLNNDNLQYELGATVTIEGKDNSVYALPEKTSGHYSISQLNLNTAVEYRLHISTGAGREYVSDFVSIRNNPPIDSISWKLEKDGVQLYMNTHDPQNNSRFYQWEYTETWQFRSAFGSTIKYFIIPGSPGGNFYSVGFRNQSDYDSAHQILMCWRTNLSSNLVLGSTEKLNNDVVFLPLTFIPPGAQRLSILYSIDVKQHTWTKAGYDFLQRMKKNTEATGSVFDAQPSELNGNLRCISNPDEPVIGYFNISFLQEKRIFISRSDLTDWNYNSGCIQIELDNKSDVIAANGQGLMPTTPAKLDPFGGIISFYVSEPICVDCTLTGSRKKPSFWP